MRASLLILMLAAPALAGCLGASTDNTADGPVDVEALLSKQQFAALAPESVFYEARDGTQMHARVFRPDTTSQPEWRAPVILEMSPYYPSLFREDILNPAEKPAGRWHAWLIDHFVPRGYAVVLADVPGTGESGGCLDQTGPAQIAAGYDTVEHFAAQPWSSGKVGTIGISYPGETQISVAGLAPPHLTTIVPLAAVSDQYNYSYYGGVPYTLAGIGTMAAYWATSGAPPPTQPESIPTYPHRHTCHPENVAAGADYSGTYSQYWRERDYKPNAPNIEASVLYVHGLQDWNVKPNAIAGMYDAIVAPKKAIFGQWSHNFPDGNSYNEEWSRADWKTTVHRWFDHWLLGIDTGIMGEPTVEVQDSLGRWRYEPDWPPSAANATPLFLSGDGTLTYGADRIQQGPVAWVDDSLATQSLGDAAPMLPLPDNKVSFLSGPLAADLHYSGQPWVELLLGSDKESTHLVAHLVDVAPDGTQKTLNRGYLSTPHRDSLHETKDWPVGDSLPVRFPMFPQDDVIPKGHQIRLDLMSDDDWTASDNTLATNTVHPDGQFSRLVLPVVTPDLDAVGFAPPYLEE